MNSKEITAFENKMIAANMMTPEIEATIRQMRNKIRRNRYIKVGQSVQR